MATAQFVISEEKGIRYCDVQKILESCGSEMEELLGVDLAVRGGEWSFLM